MIILDTNVVSEAMRPDGSPVVFGWLNRQANGTLYITSTVLAELLVGIEYLPEGRRKQNLATSLETAFGRIFDSRILNFDEASARSYSLLMRRARSSGHIVSLGDGQIAAVAAVHRFTVASRDTAPFLAAGVPVLNPWQE